MNVSSHWALPFNGSAKRQHTQQPVDCSCDEQNLGRVLRHRPWIYQCDFETSSEDESDLEQVHAVVKSASLPIGVVRGWPSCASCQKVIARWQPEAGCRPLLDEAPAFFPLEEEFRDTIKYIASISAEAEQYGICRIVPPHSWQPPCPLRDFEKWKALKFPTRIQQIHKLQVRGPQHKRYPQSKKRRAGRLAKRGPSWQRSLFSSECHKEFKCHLPDEDDEFGFYPGPDFTIEAFEKYAHQFKEAYFGVQDGHLGKNTVFSDSKKRWEPSIDNIEGEYWRIVEHATEQIEVLYGADIETSDFGSGFPKAKPGEEPSSYEKSGWNLNNIAWLPGSVLAFEEGNISGVQVPWLYVGMCFSSFCWHVEDHHFYSLNYMHWGSPKVWYGVPSSAAFKLEEVMKKHLPYLFKQQPDLLHKLVTQLSPSILKAAGVPTYRAVQKAGEFVVTFPRAYHTGFNCGFNCAEAVNVAPVDWLPHGQSAVELYREQHHKTSVSHDKLLIGAAKQALRTLQEENREDLHAFGRWGFFDERGVLVKALKKRVEMECVRRDGLGHLVHIRRMDDTFDAMIERECFICCYDLHLSAVGCNCCPEQYACLEHVDLLCACGQERKFALYRYEISELNNIVKALEGWPEAVNICLKNKGVSGFSTSMPIPLNSEDWKENSLIGLSKYDSACLSKVVLTHESDNSILDSGLIEGGCILNQQSHEFQKPTTYMLQVHSSLWPEPATASSQANVNVVGESIILDFEHSKAAVPDSVTQDVKGMLRGSMLSTQKLEPATTHALVTLNSYLEPRKLHAVESTTGSMIDELTSCGQQMIDTKVCAVQETSFSSLSRPKPHDADESLSKENPDLIILSDDEDNHVGSEFHQSRDANTEKVADLLSKLGQTSSSEGMNILALNNQDLNCKDGGCCRSSLGEEVCYSRFPTEQGVKHTEDMGKSDGLADGPSDGFYTLSAMKPTECCLMGSCLDQLLLGVKTNLSCAERHRYFKKQPNRRNTAGNSIVCRPDALGNSPFLPKLQRNNFEVELLDVGRLVLRKAWCNKHAIFPAGFKSRVLFYSIIDPLQTCFYVSEVLDSGQDEPLFKVAMESHPSEVFIHPSIDRSWQMVQEQVNTAICLQHGIGKLDLHYLQAVEYLCGMDLFGFTSPDIVKAVELLDWQHQCIEYWAGRLSAVELLESQHQLQVSYMNGVQRRDSVRDLCKTSNDVTSTRDVQIERFCVGRCNRPEEVPKDCSSGETPSMHGTVHLNRQLYNTLSGLFKRATPNELWTLHRLFASEWGDLDWKDGLKALKDELDSRC